MTSLLVTVLPMAEEAAEHGKKLPMDPILVGIIAFVLLMLLLGFLWSFRNAGLKHDRVAQAATHGHAAESARPEAVVVANEPAAGHGVARGKKH